MEIDDPIRNFQQLKAHKFDEEKYKTATSIDQVKTNFPNSNTYTLPIFICNIFFELAGHRTPHREMLRPVRAVALFRPQQKTANDPSHPTHKVSRIIFAFSDIQLRMFG